MSSSGLLDSEAAVTPQHKARRPSSSPLWVHGLLFVLTCFSTTSLGMRYMYNFKRGIAPLSSPEDVFPYGWIARHLTHLGWGVPFSITLLGILLAHEFGHYFTCRWFGVRASLPYLLPAPTLSGTVGALIRLRSRIRSPRALLLIGASGPIAGFIVAVVTSLIGLSLSTPEGADAPASAVQLHAPWLMEILHQFVRRGNPTMPDIYHIVPHPMVVASWIGLLITAINLIPAGQLDGGHIAYALSPRLHRISTQVTIGTLIFFGVVYWMGWLLWAILLMLPAMRHVDGLQEEEIGWRYKLLVPLCAVVFLLCFSMQPFSHASLLWEFANIGAGE